MEFRSNVSGGDLVAGAIGWGLMLGLVFLIVPATALSNAFMIVMVIASVVIFVMYFVHWRSSPSRLTLQNGKLSGITPRGEQFAIPLSEVTAVEFGYDDDDKTSITVYHSAGRFDWSAPAAELDTFVDRLKDSNPALQVRSDNRDRTCRACGHVTLAVWYTCERCGAELR